MTRQYRLPVILAFIAVVLILAFSTRTFALAQDGNGYSSGIIRDSIPDGIIDALAQVEGGPGFYSVSPFAFDPYSYGAPSAYFGQELYNPNAGMACFEVPLDLPNKAIVNKVVAFIIDSSDQNLVVYLVRCPYHVQFCDVITSVVSGGNKVGIYPYESALLTETVDLQSNSYIVEICFPGGSGVDLGLTGLRIDYGFQSYTPIIEK